MLPNFDTIRPPDQPELIRAQDNISAAMARVVACPLLDGVLLEDVTITTSLNVTHGLGRAWRGFIITKINANATIRAATDPSPAAFLALTASLGTGVANVTVDLWVF